MAWSCCLASWTLRPVSSCSPAVAWGRRRVWVPPSFLVDEPKVSDMLEAPHERSSRSRVCGTSAQPIKGRVILGHEPGPRPDAHDPEYQFHPFQQPRPHALEARVWVHSQLGDDGIGLADKGMNISHDLAVMLSHEHRGRPAGVVHAGHRDGLGEGLEGGHVGLGGGSYRHRRLRRAALSWATVVAAVMASQ